MFGSPALRDFAAASVRALPPRSRTVPLRMRIARAREFHPAECLVIVCGVVDREAGQVGDARQQRLRLRRGDGRRMDIQPEADAEGANHTRNALRTGGVPAVRQHHAVQADGGHQAGVRLDAGEVLANPSGGFVEQGGTTGSVFKENPSL